MKFYMAPMEGITGYIYRNAYENCFANVDRYYTPFIVATPNKKLGSRELNDVLPQNNIGKDKLVPQIMSNDAKSFVRVAKLLVDMGYEEVNLNLGCPSKTVVSKGRGSGFLDDVKGLDRFFEEVFSKADFKISIKTRIGKEFVEEFYDILDIYNKYPIHEIIVHPRTQIDYYGNKPHMEFFEYAINHSKNPICYNGDIFDLESYERLIGTYKTDAVMLGRGILYNPNLVGILKNDGIKDKKVFRDFHNQILDGYVECMPGATPVLFKMKELWGYMGKAFNDSAKYMKKIKKVTKLEEYKSIVNNLFLEKDLIWE